MNKNQYLYKLFNEYGIDYDIYIKIHENISRENKKITGRMIIHRFITRLQKEYIKLKTENKLLKEQLKLKDELVKALIHNSQIEQPPPKYEPNNEAECKNRGDGGDTL